VARTLSKCYMSPFLTDARTAKDSADLGWREKTDTPSSLCASFHSRGPPIEGPQCEIQGRMETISWGEPGGIIDTVYLQPSRLWQMRASQMPTLALQTLTWACFQTPTFAWADVHQRSPPRLGFNEIPLAPL
jgi:hypothetical protein